MTATANLFDHEFAVKATEHSTIQTLLNTLLEDYPDHLEKTDFRKLMKNILPWYEDGNIDNLFDLIDVEKCHLTHRIPKDFCTHELANIVLVRSLRTGCTVV